MALCLPFGILAYNVSQPAPHGFITKKLVKQYPVGLEPSQFQRENALAGQTFKEIPNPQDPIYGGTVWVEERLLLPATELTVEFVYRTKSQSNNLSLLQFAEESGPSLSGVSVLGGGAGATLALSIANSIFLGGVVPVRSKFAWHACSSRTSYDIPVQITEEILDSGQIEMSEHLMTIIGVFDEPLGLTEEEKERIGETSRVNQGMEGDESYVGSLIEGQNRDIDDDGAIDFVSFFEPTNTQTALEIYEEKNRYNFQVYDERVYRFRSDSQSASPQTYAFQLNEESFQDLSTKIFKIKTDGLEAGDTVYVSGTFVNEHFFRQLMFHDALLFEEPTPTAIGRAGSSFILAIKSDVSAYNYKFLSWRVPKNIEEEKVSLDTFTKDPEKVLEEPTWDEVKGWRIVDLIAINTNDFYAADSRGILRSSPTGSSVVIIPRDQITNDNQTEDSWYQKYLVENNLVDNNFDDIFNINTDLTGHMFDVSNITNSIYFDNEKLGYWRPFAEALKNSPSNAGVVLLDFISNGTDIPEDETIVSQLDLSNIVFEDIGNASSFPSSYNASTCAGLTNFDSAGLNGDTGSFYDPIDPLNGWNLIVPIPPGNLFTDWLLGTTTFSGRFDRNTRIFVEAFLPDGALAKRYSSIHVRTNPSVEASISLDYNHERNETFAFFQSSTLDAVAHYRFRDGVLGTQLQRLIPFVDGSHDRPVFNPNDFQSVGYNFAVGDAPSYSEGAFIANDRINLCLGEVSFADLYEVEIFEIEELTDDITLDIGNNSLISNILFKYSLPDRFDNTDKFLSLEFENTGQVINNISITDAVGENRYSLETSFYGGGPLKVYSKLFSQAESVTITVVKTTEDKIRNYLITGSQTATAIDGSNKIMVFISNPTSNNIDVAYSNDSGSNWYLFTSIIRLLTGETATSPYVISEKENDTVILFYKLDGRHLVSKRIRSDWFICDDQFVTYNPLEELAVDAPDNIGLEAYTPGGQSIRKSTSYFVVGDGSEVKVANEVAAGISRSANGFLPRFIIDGNIQEQLDTAFDNASYTVWRDIRGNYHMMFVSDNGRLFYKVSSDANTWSYVFKNIVAHKTLFSDSVEELDLGIQNPQVVYSDKEDAVYLMYFFEGALYIRVFRQELLYPQNHSEININLTEGEFGQEYLSQSIFDYISLTQSDQNTKPIFIVGEVNTRVRQAFELQNAEASEDTEEELTESNIIVLPYSSEQIDRFVKNNYRVETNTKSAGYISKDGKFRGLYATQEGFIYGFTLNGNTPTLDVQLRANTS